MEGDLSVCCDRIDQAVLEDILRERFHDNRFLRLMRGLLKAGYLEEWTFTATHSGVPQGGVVSPILSKLGLDRLAQYGETPLIPAYSRGLRRRTNPPYVRCTGQGSAARKQGEWHRVRALRQQAQRLPSRDPHDPDFRRRWYVRYADDWRLGLSGSRGAAEAIKGALATFLRHARHRERNEEKTFVTHAHDECARFGGYELQVLHENSQHDQRRQRCINGSMGLRVPPHVLHATRTQYMRRGQPQPLPQRTLAAA